MEAITKHIPTKDTRLLAKILLIMAYIFDHLPKHDLDHLGHRGPMNEVAREAPNNISSKRNIHKVIRI